jgi:retinal pigment epithelial membrane protein
LRDVKSAQALALPPALRFNEPVHVPPRHRGHEGWLLTQVDHQLGSEEFEHAVWILDAGNIAAALVARISIPHRVRLLVRGNAASNEASYIGDVRKFYQAIGIAVCIPTCWLSPSPQAHGLRSSIGSESTRPSGSTG